MDCPTPGGLRTGSPPFPPPRSIRPTVRRLPRSPRLWVRVPIDVHAETASGRGGVRVDQLLKPMGCKRAFGTTRISA